MCKRVLQSKKGRWLLLFAGALLAVCLLSWYGFWEKGEKIGAVRDFAADGLTLLQRTYEDTDRDAVRESVELYTSAELAPDGQMGWDTGHEWVLLVRKDEEVYPLFRERVQYGEMQFWIVCFNKKQITGPESGDLERHIYAMLSSSSGGIALLNYFWDEQSRCYRKKVVFNPPKQWGVRHPNQYTLFDPSKIELPG